VAEPGQVRGDAAGQLLARLRRQDHDRAVGAGAGRERGQHGGPLGPGAYDLRQVSPQGWTATASPGAGTAAGAVDGDASTRYTTGTGQAPGQYLQADFGRAIPARQVVFDTGTSTGDYPRGYAVTTSTDGVTWHTAVASAAGTGQFTTVPLSGAPVRYVRITLTASSGSWFSVADVRAYR
jgi:glucosylceramidase